MHEGLQHNSAGSAHREIYFCFLANWAESGMVHTGGGDHAGVIFS